jgi:hypothetical protein
LYYVKIEMASYIDGLKKIVKFTCGAESDGQHVFSIEKKIDDIIAYQPQQGLCDLPS